MLDNGLWILVVVDGRSSKSRGMTLLLLALYLKQRGCVTALNLDGGGSSTMVVNDALVNIPSGRDYALVFQERSISDAVLVVPHNV